MVKTTSRQEGCSVFVSACSLIVAGVFIVVLAANSADIDGVHQRAIRMDEGAPFGRDLYQKGRDEQPKGEVASSGIR